MIQYDTAVPAFKGAIKMDRVCGRKGSRETDAQSHDTLQAVKSYQHNVYPVNQTFVSLEKQTKRRFEDLVSGTDYYSNIKRENDRADRLKKLLNPE